METQVRTPQSIFTQPQRLIVPLFQRPYVWNQENQWEPLWEDVARVAERLLQAPKDKVQPHFLGAVVLQQIQNPIGLMQERTIIDGQQRLTTIQLFLDALHAELMAANMTQPAMRIEPLITNAEPFRSKPEDRFKVWPTNRDRPAFNAVMGVPPPVNHDTVGFKGDRMVDAHRFFSQRCREWLQAHGGNDAATRASAIETVVRDLLQMVVIDLAADENAQEIFETLNARGAQLTAADLIKNFIFQRLLESGADVESIYETRWKDFETGFWEAEVSVGRLRYPRSSIFLNHWLVARTGEEVVAREIFSRFKTFANFDSTHVPMPQLLVQVHRAAVVYRDFVAKSLAKSGAMDRLGLFVYRTGVLESEVIKPLLLFLLDPEQPALSDAQLNKALDCIESWMVRRMLVRATTKSYNKLMAEIITKLQGTNRMNAGDIIEDYLRKQTSASGYWPDDNELSEEILPLLAYRRLGRGRLRMVLEAIEDHLRGWQRNKSGLGGERVPRSSYAIEHVMPRKWVTHWPVLEGPDAEMNRERLIHTFGNLTLLTGKLNTKVSNGPWVGPTGKRAALQAHDVLIMNRELLTKGSDQWTEEAIRRRTEEMAKTIIEIWPVPKDHRSGFSPDKVRHRKKVLISDLISGGALSPGVLLYPRRKSFADRVATVLSDGRIELDGKTYASPSEAASALTGTSMNGWWFFWVDPAARRSLRHVRRDYVSALAVDTEDDDSDEDDEDEE